jgi:hypothetical protein
MGKAAIGCATNATVTVDEWTRPRFSVGGIRWKR